MTAGSATTRQPLRRLTTGATVHWRDIRAALLSAAIVTPVAAVNGGYSPSTSGWPTLALAWAAGLALLVRSTTRLGRAEIGVLACVAGLAAWTALSLLWSPSAGDTMLELERTVLYASALAASLLVVRSGSYRALLGGVLAATTLTASYGLLTRLFPTDFPASVAVAGNRLAEPLGYWNAVGVMAALGILLALGFVAHGRSVPVRAVAAATVLPQTLTLYFTFSRGAWLALGIGLVTAVILDPLRHRLVVALAAAGLPAAAAVALASRQDSLTHTVTVTATAEGRQVLLAAVVLGIVAAVAAGGAAVASRSVTFPDGARRGFAGGLALAAAAALLGVFLQFGSPQTLASRGWRAFNAPPVVTGNDLNARLFTFSGSWRTDLWRAALNDAADHPVLGSGAGTYEDEWLHRRTVRTDVLNAHNLYFETVAELGAVGLALLLGVLGLPLVVVVAARRRTLVPVAAGAYVTFLVHAVVDWDWEIPALTLAALFTGAALLAAARRDDRVSTLASRPRVGIAVGLAAIAAVAAVGLVGNRATLRAERAASAARWEENARQAARAETWQPWSSAPLLALGEAQLQQGKLRLAQATFSRAIERDSENWRLWLDLALASKGPLRTAAAQKALALNPLSSEIDLIRPALGLPKRAKP